MKSTQVLGLMILGLSSSLATQAADLRRNQQLVREALQAAEDGDRRDGWDRGPGGGRGPGGSDGIGWGDGRGDRDRRTDGLRVASYKLQTVQIDLRDLPHSRVLSDVTSLLSQTIYALEDRYSSDSSKLQTLRYNAPLLIRGLQDLERFDDGDDRFGSVQSLRDALTAMDDVTRIVYNRNYGRAERRLQRIRDYLSRIRYDRDISRAIQAVDTILVKINDPYVSDRDKVDLVTDCARVFRDAVQSSDAYRREGSNPYPPSPYPPSPYPPSPPPSRAVTVSCWSMDRNTNTCVVGEGIRYARLISQSSSAPCVQGRTWGYDSRAIWVSDGCRATFEVDVFDRWGRRP